MVSLVEKVLADTTTQKNTQDLLLTILASDPTRAHAVELETWALEEMLKNEWVINFVKDFLRSIVNDAFVQQEVPINNCRCLLACLIRLYYQLLIIFRFVTLSGWECHLGCRKI